MSADSMSTQSWLTLRDILRGVLVAVQMWLFSRTRILRTVVCVLLLTGFTAVLFVAPGESQSEIVREYLQRAQRALQSEQWDAANLYFQRCLWIDPGQDKARFGLALIAQQQSDEPRAWALMSEIAPLDTGGDPRAHIWLARKLLAQESPHSARSLQAAETHLVYAIKALPDRSDAREMLVGLYLQQRRLDEAVEQLKRIARSKPETYFLLNRLCRDGGKQSLAKNAAEDAADVFRGQIERNPRDTEARIKLASAHVLMDSPAAAEQVLRDGLAIEENKTLREALADVIMIQYDRAAAQEATSSDDKLELLAAALQVAPGNPQAMARLAQLTADVGTEADTARVKLKAALAKGKAPAIVHLILGTIALEDGEEEQAEVHLDQALALDPNMPAVLNNLAWALFHSDPPRTDRALSLVNQAIQLVPNHPECRATRGVILLAQGEPRKAITDLELALGRFPQREDLHAALADAYELVGDSELAAEHRKLLAPGKTDPKAAIGSGHFRAGR